MYQKRRRSHTKSLYGGFLQKKRKWKQKVIKETSDNNAYKWAAARPPTAPLFWKKKKKG